MEIVSKLKEAKSREKKLSNSSLKKIISPEPSRTSASLMSRTMLSLPSMTFLLILTVALMTVAVEVVMTMGTTFSHALSSSSSSSSSSSGPRYNPLGMLITNEVQSFKKANPYVPLTYCTMFGKEGSFRLEWQVTMAPKYAFEIRYTTLAIKGAAGIGFTNGTVKGLQVIEGFPTEYLRCMRKLFDTLSTYDLYGEVPPNSPELPTKISINNGSHIVFYLSRNLTVSSAEFIKLYRTGGAKVDVTIIWSFLRESVFKQGCYMAAEGGNAHSSMTETATYSLILTDARYKRNSTGVASNECVPFDGAPKSFASSAPSSSSVASEPLMGELNENKRLAMIFIGGDLLTQSGKAPPVFKGSVIGGNDANGMCNAVTNVVFAAWSGFSDPIGGIARYELTAGTVDLPMLYFERYDVGRRLSIRLPLSPLTASTTPMRANTSYVVQISAYNHAGLSTTEKSVPIFVLNNGVPIAGKVYDGGDEDHGEGVGVAHNTVNGHPVARYQRVTDRLKVYLDNWISEEHSTKSFPDGKTTTDNGLEYTVVTDSSYRRDKRRDVAKDEIIVNWTSLPSWAPSFTINGLNLTNGIKYKTTVRSRNCAGLFTTAASPGIVVDTMAPTPGSVRYGNYTLVIPREISSRRRIRLTWWGFYDAISGIARYEWGASLDKMSYSSSSGAGVLADNNSSNNNNNSTRMVISWRNVGTRTHIETASLGSASELPFSLIFNKDIYFLVRATDAAGNYVIKAANATKVIE